MGLQHRSVRFFHTGFLFLCPFFCMLFAVGYGALILRGTGRAHNVGNCPAQKAAVL
jgi:hypothetical protein